MKSTNMGADDGKFGREAVRRVMAGILMWGGWFTSASVFLYATLEYDPNKGNFAPQWVGFTFIGALCVGIAGTLVRSRMRLQDTILQAFAVGVAAAQLQAEKDHEELARRINDNNGN